MNEQAIQEQYQHIVTLLKQQRLKEAQSQLEAFLWNSGDWTLRNRLEQAQTSYQYMLQYMRQGIDDPERQKLYRQILTETWEVADQARLSLLDGVSTHYYHSLRNNRERLPKEYNIAALQKVLESFPDDLAVCQLMPDNQGMDAVLQRHEQTAQVLFLSTWSNSDWSAEDEQQAKGLLESEMLPVNDLCLFTSAVMLSLMECFDTRKFSWLLDAVTHANTDYNNVLSTQLASGEGPDIIMDGTNYPAEIKAGNVEDISDYDFVKEFNEAGMSLCSADGKIYGIPSYGWFSGIWCNASILEECGVEIPKPYAL